MKKNVKKIGFWKGQIKSYSDDGKWIFPEGYDHYLTQHQLKPDKIQFIKDAVGWAQ